MKIIALKEKEQGEYRVAITPESAKLFCKNNYEVWVEAGAGDEAGFQDEEYIEAGAKISHNHKNLFENADIVLKVKPTSQADPNNETSLLKKHAVIIGLLNTFLNSDLIGVYQQKELTTLSMELVPRITRAQSMDALSSQANLAGYRAVIEACNELTKAIPMLMTAAGTVQPAKVLVLGAGVAGLQAIATAKRLGAVVSSMDARQAAKEQVESLGAKFLTIESNENFETKAGYAKEVSKDYKLKQEALLKEQIVLNDIVITTAQVLGKPAPKLITKAMVESMKPGSVIVDIAAISGGNCELTELDKIIEYKGIKIIGYSNLAAKVAYDASKLYAKNLYNLVMHIFAGGKSLELNIEDEIVKAMLVTYKGKRYI